MSQVYIISELCGQWGGSVERAEQMILQSKMAGANAVKVQLYDTYRMQGENREKWEYLSMRKDQFTRLLSFSRSLNIDFFASAFHADRFGWIVENNISINKIASGLLKNDFYLAASMVNTGMKTYVSLGKWEKEELPFKDDNVKYFHCISKYPHDASEALEQMPKSFDEKLVGYSDHSIGMDACTDAVLKGATVIEKHFTIDKNLQCETESAHACSMTYQELVEFRNFCESVNV